MINTIKDLKDILHQEFTIADSNNLLENSHNSSIVVAG
jgi:hypothetical protein